MLALPELQADPRLPESARETLHMLQSNVELEVRLIDDLLDLTAVRKGGYFPELFLLLLFFGEFYSLGRTGCFRGPACAFSVVSLWKGKMKLHPTDTDIHLILSQVHQIVRK